MSTPTPNQTVKAHLRAVTNAERAKTFGVIAWARFGVVFIYTLSTVYYAQGPQRDESAVETLPLFLAYSGFALLVALGGKSPLLSRYAGWIFGVLDIPIITAAGWIALPLAPATTHPAYFLTSTVIYTAAAIVISVLALDLWAITAAGVAGFVGTAVLLVRLDASSADYFDPLFGVVAVMVGCWTIVWRLRAVVEESRRKDFAGKYVLGERIGAGGMAEVFAATYSPEGGFERRVAVKRVLPSWANNADFIALFRREAEVGAQLAHPNLVQVLDYGRHIDSWFIAMEFVEGVSLSSVLRTLNQRGEPLPLNVACYVIAEVAEAMTYLQERPSPDGKSVGLVHRDLNPPNVLLSKLGAVKVSDFGVARWTDSQGLTETGAVRGKVAYMAPESLHGAKPSTLADQFSLGALAWEVLTGRKVFAGENEGEVVRAVLEGVVQPPSALRPEIPPAVDEVVLQLLERDVTKRAASARLVTQVLGGLEGPAAPYPTGRDALVALLQAFQAVPGPVPGSQPSKGPAPTEATLTTPSAKHG